MRLICDMWAVWYFNSCVALLLQLCSSIHNNIRNFPNQYIVNHNVLLVFHHISWDIFLSKTHSKCTPSFSLDIIHRRQRVMIFFHISSSVRYKWKPFFRQLYQMSINPCNTWIQNTVKSTKDLLCLTYDLSCIW